MSKPGAQWILIAALIGAPALASDNREISNGPAPGVTRPQRKGQPAIQAPGKMGANYEAPPPGMKDNPAAHIPNTPFDLELMGRLHESLRAEVALSELASTQAYSDRVRSFATVRGNDLREADQELAHLADIKGFSLASPNPQLRVMIDQERVQHAQALAKLRPLQGAEFDRQLLATLVQDQQGTISLLKGRLAGVTDDNLRRLINRQLPKLQAQLDEAQKLQKNPGGPVRRARRFQPRKP